MFRIRYIIQVVGAMVMFKRLVEDNAEISEELTNKFLGFVSFYRGDPTMPSTYSERPHTVGLHN